MFKESSPFNKQTENFSMAELLKMYRERAIPRLTQKELALQLGVSDKALRDWESDISQPTAANLKKLIGVFLVKNLLQTGQEQPEAEGLWEKRRQVDTANTFPPFDTAWFLTLIKTEPVPKKPEIEPIPTPLVSSNTTVTFLFTDLEGSTTRWEQQAPQMQKALAHHDQLVRSAIESKGGKVFKTVGDAFYATFPSAPAAMQAALLAQRNLSAQDWGELGELKVRMAIHTGIAEVRDGDYTIKGHKLRYQRSETLGLTTYTRPPDEGQ